MHGHMPPAELPMGWLDSPQRHLAMTLESFWERWAREGVPRGTPLPPHRVAVLRRRRLEGPRPPLRPAQPVSLPWEAHHQDWHNMLGPWNPESHLLSPDELAESEVTPMAAGVHPHELYSSSAVAELMAMAQVGPTKEGPN